MSLHRLTRTLVAAGLVATGLAAHAALPRYEVIDLGIPGPDIAVAQYINDSGQVLGHTGLGETFLYTPGTGVTSFNALTGLAPGVATAVFSLSNGGHVAGYLPQDGHFIYTPGAGLDFSPGSSSVRAVNATGQYVAERHTPPYGSYLYTLGVGASTVPGEAVTLNDRGDVAYRTDTGAGVGSGVLRNDGSAYDVGNLGGTNTWVNGINERGDVVGVAVTAGGQSHAFRYTAEGGIVDLDTFGFTDPGASSNAVAVNDRGWTVGQYTDGAGLLRGFLSDGTAGLVDVLSLLAPSVAARWEIDLISDINNAGQMVGHGFFDGRQRAFILNPLAAPVPEPGVAWLMLLGAPLLLRAVRKAPRA